MMISLRYGLGVAVMLGLGLVPAGPAGAATENPTGRAGTLGRPGDALRSQPARDLVKRIQKALTEDGIYQGPVDGQVNSTLTAAIRAYQKRAGLRVDGLPSEELASQLETRRQMQSVLQKLEAARESETEAARQALASRPDTRRLLREFTVEPADPTRDPTPCYRAPTVRCLLEEAVESAKTVSLDNQRDWALGEILAAQAKAGLTEAAMDTASRIRDVRLIVVALRTIAKAQAEAGRMDEAALAAAAIPDTTGRIEALIGVAEAYVGRRPGTPDGKTAVAKRALDQAETEVTRLSGSYERVVLLGRMAVAWSRLGDSRKAERAVQLAREAIQSASEDGKDAMLRHVAATLADMGQTAEALAILRDAAGDGESAPVLIAAASAQARAGDAAGALETAESIEAVRYRALVLSRVAVAQAARGDKIAALATLGRARDAGDRIDLPFARAYALSQIVAAQGEIGEFDAAAATAEIIGDERLKAQMLWTVAKLRAMRGDAAGAARTEGEARQATDAIASTFSRSWMFADLASGWALAGDVEAARQAFAEGLSIAAGITNSWARARALGRLAEALVDLH